MTSEYDLRFGYEYKLFESLNQGCLTLTSRKKLVRFVVVRVEYDRSSRYVCIRIGNRSSLAVAHRRVGSSLTLVQQFALLPRSPLLPFLPFPPSPLSVPLEVGPLKYS